MSSVFLPFVTELSSGTAIFKAIVKHTKGSTDATIANLFSIILTLGIVETRKHISSYSGNLTTQKKITELLYSFPELHVLPSDLLFWYSVARMRKKPTKLLNTFTAKEVLILFAVSAVIKPEILLAEDFDVDIEKYKAYRKAETIYLSDLPGIKITEKDSTKVGFTSFEQFMAYIACKENTGTEIRIMPVRVKTGYAYNSNQCRSPYLWE